MVSQENIWLLSPKTQNWKVKILAKTLPVICHQKVTEGSCILYVTGVLER